MEIFGVMCILAVLMMGLLLTYVLYTASRSEDQVNGSELMAVQPDGNDLQQETARAPSNNPAELAEIANKIDPGGAPK